MKTKLSRMDRAIAHRDDHHSYMFKASLNLYQIHEPMNRGFELVATLHGSPMHDGTHMQADSICRALDRLAKKACAID